MHGRGRQHRHTPRAARARGRGGPRPRLRPDDAGAPPRPARTRVLLDERTAICVRSEVLEGPLAGTGHDLRVEAVDEDLIDDLFAAVRLDLTDVSKHLPWPVGP